MPFPAAAKAYRSPHCSKSHIARSAGFFGCPAVKTSKFQHRRWSCRTSADLCSDHRDVQGVALCQIERARRWHAAADRQFSRLYLSDYAYHGQIEPIAAGVAEVDVDRGEIQVTKFWTAIDAGLIVTPDNALNQIKGGIIFGISMALSEKIGIENGQVVQENFYDYEIIRAFQAPEIESYVADVDAPPMGCGQSRHAHGAFRHCECVPCRAGQTLAAHALLARSNRARIRVMNPRAAVYQAAPTHFDCLASGLSSRPAYP